MKYANIREEELKNKISQDYFWLYDCTKIIGNVDFCVGMLTRGYAPVLEQESLLWAEAKKGSSDVYKSLVQLILTIGKARTFDKHLPPAFLGAFDSEKIAFIPYSDIHDVFYLNDFNWNVAPSNYDTKEFKLLYERITSPNTQLINHKEREPDCHSRESGNLMHQGIAGHARNDTQSFEIVGYIFDYLKDDAELRRFIKHNFADKRFGVTKTKIDKNNFIIIYNKWLDAVHPTISFNWEAAKKNDIISADFYLADLLSDKNSTFKENLSIVLRSTRYEMNRYKDEYGAFTTSSVYFSDNQKAHTQFWNRYERPPKEEYWDYIINRRDLLVPQDIRERKGSFYTPRIWVELSQQYLADVFGENWQDEYYVWDCCAGTGNLLAGLTNKYNLWASTIDKADVAVMKDRIANGANLLESHVFRFDFLNDDFTTLPQGLQDIINNEKLRRKLIIYINPPYSETNNKSSGDRSGVSFTNIGEKYSNVLGSAKKELFAQFLARIYFEIHDCKIAEFSTQKALIAPNFKDFRKFFFAKLKKCFVIPADTFDNVKGKFPIGFKVWDTNGEKHFKNATADIYDATGIFVGKKIFTDGLDCKYINEWIKEFRNKSNVNIGNLYYTSNDFQQQNSVNISSPNEIFKNHLTKFEITINNLIPACIYFAVRKCIKATWLNDRDQFLYPNNKWKKDLEFQNDCLTYTLFNNNIQSKYGVNHWIPFMEREVNARDTFESHFMMSFMGGKLIQNGYSNLFEEEKEKPCIKREFSPEANTVFNAGRELCRYYHTSPPTPLQNGEGSVNASLYDIREYFQGRNENGKMNNTSTDEKYNELIKNLRDSLEVLALKIEPKVYEYGFLK